MTAAMYEHEVLALSRAKSDNAHALKKRLTSLPYYINQAAFAMCQSHAPLEMDSQNASWIAPQPTHFGNLDGAFDAKQKWFTSFVPKHGLILPVLAEQQGVVQVYLDSIDSIDVDNGRFRTNRFGWFNYLALTDVKINKSKALNPILLKPCKKAFACACAGHRWQGGRKINPVRLTLRELLLSCAINWKNFKKPLTN